MSNSQIQRDALNRAQNGESVSNIDRIITGFIEMGVPEADILPRENVFSYQAWRGLGRQVQKGQHGVKVRTWITDKKTGKRFPRTVSVFHVTQTAEREQKYVRCEVIATEPDPQVDDYSTPDVVINEPHGTLASLAASLESRS